MFGSVFEQISVFYVNTYNDLKHPREVDNLMIAGTH